MPPHPSPPRPTCLTNELLLAHAGKGYGQATAIDVSGLGLSSVEDGLLDQLPALKSLDLSNNNLTSVTFGSRSVETLDLSNNKLVSVRGLRDFINLREITITGNDKLAMDMPMYLSFLVPTLATVNGQGVLMNKSMAKRIDSSCLETIEELYADVMAVPKKERAAVFRKKYQALKKARKQVTIRDTFYLRRLSTWFHSFHEKFDAASPKKTPRKGKVSKSKRKPASTSRVATSAVLAPATPPAHAASDPSTPMKTPLPHTIAGSSKSSRRGKHSSSVAVNQGSSMMPRTLDLEEDDDDDGSDHDGGEGLSTLRGQVVSPSSRRKSSTPSHSSLTSTAATLPRTKATATAGAKTGPKTSSKGRKNSSATGHRGKGKRTSTQGQEQHGSCGVIVDNSDTNRQKRAKADVADGLGTDRSTTNRRGKKKSSKSNRRRSTDDPATKHSSVSFVPAPSLSNASAVGDDEVSLSLFTDADTYLLGTSATQGDSSSQKALQGPQPQFQSSSTVVPSRHPHDFSGTHTEYAFMLYSQAQLRDAPASKVWTVSCGKHEKNAHLLLIAGGNRVTLIDTTLSMSTPRHIHKFADHDSEDLYRLAWGWLPLKGNDKTPIIAVAGAGMYISFLSSTLELLYEIDIHESVITALVFHPIHHNVIFTVDDGGSIITSIIDWRKEKIQNASWSAAAKCAWQANAQQTSTP